MDGAGNDTLSADAGTVEGRGGDDLIRLTNTAQGYGNQGNDRLIADDSSKAFGGYGNDTMSVAGMADVLNGTVSSTDTNTGLYGGYGQDALSAAGNDSVYGSAGDDRLFGMGSAGLHGDAGNDVFEAYNGVKMWGGAGGDTLDGDVWNTSGAAMPLSYGGDGNDLMIAGAGLAYGGAGNDLMVGDGFDDLPLYEELGTTLPGGAGDDIMTGWQDAQVAGDAGNDRISLGNGADGYGGAGDDSLILSPTVYGTHADGGLISATGGAGADDFAIDMVASSVPSGNPDMEITDFVTGTDRLLVDAVDNGYVYDHATLSEDSVAGHSDVTLHWRPQDGGAEMTSVLRLRGVMGFDPALIEVASEVEPHLAVGTVVQPVIGPVLTQVAGSDAANSLTGQSDALIHAGAGNDTVSTATDGEVVAVLGDGNDSFAGNGDGAVVFGGAGNDSVVFHANRDATTVASGDAGNDRLEALAGTGKLALSGGDGDDVVMGRAGQSLDGGSGADQVTLTVTAAELTANGAATVRIDDADHLTVVIDPALQGAVQFAYQTAGNGVDVTRIMLKVGTTTVAEIQGGGSTMDNVITLDDPRLTITRA